MNKKHKLKSSVVLDTLQSLYDKQFTSYPRTDCQQLTSKTAGGLKSTISNNLEGIKDYIQNSLI